MSKVYRVNTNSKAITYEEFKEEYRTLGNRGLIAKVLNDEENPLCDSLGSENKLIVCTGIFAGTPLSTAHRVSFGGKSPLTGGIKESNVGGNLGTFIAQHGIKMFVFEDLPQDDRWYYLKIGRDSAVELLPVGQYVGLNTYAFVEKMHEIYGKNIAVAAIGTAGERGYRIASVMVTDNATGHPSRAAGRGGMGSVMGSKKIKAIVVEKAAARCEVIYVDKDRFNAGMKKFVETILHDPAAKGLNTAGTHGITDMNAALNILPVRNFSGDLFEDDKLENVSVDAFLEKFAKNGGRTGIACQPGCLVKCSNVYVNSKGDYVTGGLEYETTALCGPNCDIDDLEYLAEVDRFCDDLGVDSIEVGNTLAVCMEAGTIPWGDRVAAKGLLNEMFKGTELGNLLGQGTASVGKALGVLRVPVVKGQALAAYDPRSLKGQGVTYCLTPMGADHTAGNTIVVPGISHKDKEGKVELSVDLQLGTAAVDNLGCVFCASYGLGPDMLPEMFAGLLGGEWNMEKVIGIGIETIRLEKTFNQAAGFTSSDDNLPDFFAHERTASGSVWDIHPDELAKGFPVGIK